MKLDHWYWLYQGFTSNHKWNRAKGKGRVERCRWWGQKPELYYYLDLHKEGLSLVWHGSQPMQKATKSARQYTGVMEQWSQNPWGREAWPCGRDPDMWVWCGWCGGRGQGKGGLPPACCPWALHTVGAPQPGDEQERLMLKPSHAAGTQESG